MKGEEKLGRPALLGFARPHGNRRRRTSRRSRYGLGNFLMVLLLQTMTLNNWINYFTTHQTPPPRHPNLTTRGHIHKVINNHRSLAARTFHKISLPLHVIVIDTIGEITQDLEKFLV